MNISDTVQAAVQFIDQQPAAIALVIAILVLLVFFLRKKIRLAWLNFKTRRCLNRLGHKQISNLKWPDGLGNFFSIDRLILRPDGITVLNCSQYPGKIFCADAIDEWTQMVGQKSYRFENPLRELDLQIKAISASIPNVPVDGFLFFHHLAEFPKGHPERVIYLENMPAELQKDNKTEVDASVDAAWNEILMKAHA